MYKKIGEAVVYVVVFLGTLLVMSLVMALPTMWLFNYLFAPSFISFLFGVDHLTYWKAYWLVWLCSILLKGSSSSSSNTK